MPAFASFAGFIGCGFLTICCALPFTPGNILVLSAPGGTSASTTISLVELLSGAGGGATVQSLSPGSPCTISGTAISEGKLTASEDGRTVSWACYSVAAGSASVSSSTSASVTRVAQSINATGLLRPSAPLQIPSTYSGSSVRSAVAADAIGNY
jgi:hypothetical protein